MTLTALDPDRTAAIRRKYGGPVHTPLTRKYRGQRKWTDVEDTHLYLNASTCTVKQLCAALGRGDFSMRSRLKALGLKALPERQR